MTDHCKATNVKVQVNPMGPQGRLPWCKTHDQPLEICEQP